MPEKLIVGNWKMNGTRLSISTLLSDIAGAGPFPGWIVSHDVVYEDFAGIGV
ncbi:hypothetical protein [Duganella radicis]|uniref:Triose-phosphate isomerase n=1 Tax=Duganella radicis TaxID=551988 RepID=A0A6L6PRN7_9BURK|nr:hypothetical protein [Duganella radicis]MTV41439.1 hypothetical protein [Duganella radicis]